MIDLGMYGTACTVSDRPESTLTMDMILESIRELEKALPLKPLQLGPLSLRVYESAYLDYLIPVRMHFRRRTQSENYHWRIQKKWLKRFGRKQNDCVYMFSDRMFGQGMIASPKHAVMIRNVARQSV
jgi:hypothetical protein